MPRYFFSTHLDGDVIADPDGTVLRDADAAWETALKTARAALRQAGRDDRRLLAAVLVVTDAAGEVVLEFPFVEAVTSVPDPTEGER
ncbi:hypothetical protein [Methylobacterium sp. Leaf466]|uniref:DUF6894 family protein n=1 Tax=Methylobacterium sp. Leaf466 TaxID=1736386 RepID=UPI0006F6D8DD|nr:hypothetical protein [Methylobacterium sp. Leaf466]KQT77740.1 hypothetical protein ASG59_10395 [Methylobacterium sp. Leaf466]